MSTPGGLNNLLLASAVSGGGATGYQIERSLRFNSSDSAYLSRTPASAGNQRTWTWAGWVKKGTNNERLGIFGTGTSNINWTNLFFDSSDNTIQFRSEIADVVTCDVKTQPLYRDPSAWYHLVFALDATNSTSVDRVKIYINGVRQALAILTTPGNSSSDYLINTTNASAIGARSRASFENYLNGYLADVHFVDGQALDPTSFGEFDATTGVWNPIEYTFGTNPNDGTTWSSYGDANVDPSFPWTNAFNGNVATTNYVSGTSTTSTWTPPTAITVNSSLRILTATGTTSGLYVNGSLVSSSGSYGNAAWTTITGVSSLSSVGTYNSGTQWTIIYAIEVDGYVLLDGAVDNSFHLDFADNSSAAALGTDTSGAGNDWTVNNISVIQGNGDYTSNTTGTFSTNRGPLKAFNGATSGTDFYAQPADGNTVTIGSLGITGITKLRMWLGKNNTGDPWGTLSLDATNVTSFLTANYPSLTATGQWIDLTSQLSGSSLSTITMTSPVANTDVRLAAVEVNDIVLIDRAAAINAGNDSLVDTPTSYGTDTGAGGEVRGNYATLNPLAAFGSPVLSNGNLDFKASGNSYQSATLTQYFPVSGKWYWECTLNVLETTAGNQQFAVGDTPESSSNGFTSSFLVYAMYADASYKYGPRGSTPTNLNIASAAGDVVQFAYDATTGKFWSGVNGTWFLSGSPSTGSNPLHTFPSIIQRTFAVIHYGTNGSTSFNAGARPFAYTAPSGFKALCTQNLDTPLIAKPSTVMDVVKRAGGGTTQTFASLRPGLVWEKRRDSASSHYLFDVNRGNDKYLNSDTTSAEGTTSGAFTFNTNSYTVSSGFDWPSGATVVDWVWDAGSSTVTNTDGSITSQVRANPSAGFSIVSYTGNGTNGATVGHSLGVSPGMIIVKNRDAAHAWLVAHSGLTSGYNLQLNTTDQELTGFSRGYISTYANTTFTLTAGSGGTSLFDNVNQNTIKYVAYCFAPVEGYSAFGSFVSNGTTDNSFVFTGFRPRFIIYKRSDGTGVWGLRDTARDTGNPDTAFLQAQDSAAEGTGNDLDILSNGFKLRNSNFASGATYIYAAFAESPFQYARAR